MAKIQAPTSSSNSVTPVLNALQPILPMFKDSDDISSYILRFERIAE